MCIVDLAIQQIEDVPRNNRSEGHGPPILRQAVHAETVRHERWIHAEENPVREARQRGDEDQPVRVLDPCGDYLDDAEDEAGDEEAPAPGAVEARDEPGRPDAGETTAGETTEGEN